MGAREGRTATGRRPPTRRDVADAAVRLRSYLDPTPLAPAPGLGEAVLLKLETVLPTGSFKVRGALSALTLLEPGTHVVTASAGNHALGVAHAAALLGLEATVVCPETASPAKLAALEAFPAELRRHGRTYDQAERLARRLARDGLHYVSPDADPAVIAGQGTIAVELLDAIDGALTVVCPVGGGGLVSGVALWAARRPDARVVGVGCAASPAMAASVEAGRVVRVRVRPTLADGLAGNLGRDAATVELVRRHVSELVSVSEEEIAHAMRFLATRHDVVAEGAGAAAAAALLSGRVRPAGTTVALVTGGNVDAETLARVLESA